MATQMHITQDRLLTYPEEIPTSLCQSKQKHGQPDSAESTVSVWLESGCLDPEDSPRSIRTDLHQLRCKSEQTPSQPWGKED